MAVTRFGVSLESAVLKKLDTIVKNEQFPNRSRALAFLVNQYKINKQWQSNANVSGAIMLVYDHHKRDLLNQLTSIQHDFRHLILSSQHVHLDHHNCLETITIKGKAKELLALSDQLKAVKGISHGDIIMSSNQ